MLAVRLPIIAPVNVVDVPVMSVGVVKDRSVDCCQCDTLPMFPLKVRLAGEVPEHIVCAEATVPPTEVELIVTVCVAVVGPLQPVALAVIMLVPLHPAT